MFAKLSLLFLILRCAVGAATRCTTSPECQCKLANPHGSGNTSVVVPWPISECNMCQLLDINSVCEKETSMDLQTFQFGFWVPYTASVDHSTVSVMKVKTPGGDVKNPQFSIRGFNTPEMQGCGRASFPGASSSDEQKNSWALDTTTTTWSWNNQYVYNVALETSCATNNRIWFYNVHVLASTAEIADKMHFTTEFNVNGVIHVATTTQSLHAVRVSSGGANFTTRALNSIYKISDFPNTLTIRPLLFRIVCSATETRCPAEWSWPIDASFSSNLQKTVTSVLHSIVLTTSTLCDVKFTQTLRIGESFSFNTTGTGCTISIVLGTCTHPHTTTSADNLKCECDKGYYGNSSSCIACSAGKYKLSSGTGNTTNPCSGCPSNSNSLEASAQCTCRTGYKMSSLQTCVLCGSGAYINESGVCKTCPAVYSSFDITAAFESGVTTGGCMAFENF